MASVNGQVVLSSARILLYKLLSNFASNPVPTLPAKRSRPLS